MSGFNCPSVTAVRL